jgi:hypothetical protein
MPLPTEAELRNALDSGLMSSVLAYDQDKLIRYRSISQPAVVEYSLNREVNLLPQGSIMVIVAREQSDELKAIQASLSDAQSTVVRDTARKIREQLLGRTVVPAMQAARAITSQDCYAELYYSSVFLTGGLCVPEGNDISAILLPYTGGDLVDSSFSFINYRRETNSPDLSALIVKRRPNLTIAEKAALDQVGPEYHVGPADLATAGLCTPGALFATVTAGLIVAAAGVVADHYLHNHGPVVNIDTHLTEEILNALGPAASARELLGIRRQALIGPQ